MHIQKACADIHPVDFLPNEQNATDADRLVIVPIDHLGDGLQRQANTVVLHVWGE